jgi:hypothetical protein
LVPEVSATGPGTLATSLRAAQSTESSIGKIISHSSAAIGAETPRTLALSSAAGTAGRK